MLSDQLIRLDQADEVTLVRLVGFRDLNGDEWRYITSRLDIDPFIIVQLYQQRWQIERFFYWIKRHLWLKHWYSESENGVLIQLYAALITFLLLKLFSVSCGSREFRQMNSEFVRWVQRHLFDRVVADEITAYLRLFGVANNSADT